jgi:enoyl-CoA hydratase/carnithine racemase
MSNAIEINENSGIVLIRFIRPEMRNPLSAEVLDSIELAIDGLSPQTQKVIFTGTGDCFASGANLWEISAISSAEAAAFARRGQKLMQKIANAPAVAAINGICYGGALDLALACRHRIASPEAVFCHPGARLGIMTGWGGTQRLPRLIGEAAALEMFLTAEPIGAGKALTIGLVDEVSPDPVEVAMKLKI